MTANPPPIAKALRPLDEAPLQAFLSNEIQVADIMEWVALQIGPCEIWQSSFSVSEEFLRRLFFLRKKIHIRDIHLVLDFKATNKTVSLWVFISQVIGDCHLADCHAKVLLFRADSGRVVSVVTSQNLTRGNRFESSVITTDHGVFNSLLSSLQNVIDRYSVPLSEIMSQAVNYELPSGNPPAD